MSSTILNGDFTVYYLSENRQKRIVWSGATGVYTVQEFYTALQDLFDEVAHLGSGVPMSAQTPREYTLGIIDAGSINPWFIDNETTKHLSGGSIQTNSWTRVVGSNTGIVRVSVSSSTIVSGDIGLDITHADGDVGTLLAIEGDYLWIRPDSSASVNNFDSTSGTLTCNAHTATQTAASQTGNSLWANVFTLGSLVSGTTLDVYQNDVQINPWWSSGHIDVLLRVTLLGASIDNGDVTILARNYSTLYDHFVTAAPAGRTPIPLAAFTDNNNQTSSGTVAGYNDIDVTFGAFSGNLGNGNGSRPYDCVVDCAQRSLTQVYEYLKYVTRSGSSLSLNGVEGEYYTGVGDVRFQYDNEATGPFVEGERIDGTSGAFGYVVSLIDNGTTGTMVLRNVHGGFVDNMVIEGQTSGATADINGEPETITPNKQAPFGAFAGGKLFAARGVWLSNYAAQDGNNFVLTDSTGTTQTPPSTIAITVTGVLAGDSVSVFRTTGDNDTIDRSMYTSHASANTSGAGTFTTSVAIASDTPAAGTLRVVNRDGSGNYISEASYEYTSWSGSVFTLSGTLSQTYDSNDTAYVPFIDTVAATTSVSVNVSYTSDRYVVTRIRKKGIVPFTVRGQVVSSGLTVTAIRTEDTIAT